ncbi:hypothetical protein Q604_UNBC06311G0002, partial [human gut metagenome]
ETLISQALVPVVQALEATGRDQRQTYLE